MSFRVGGHLWTASVAMGAMLQVARVLRSENLRDRLGIVCEMRRAVTQTQETAERFCPRGSPLRWTWWNDVSGAIGIAADVCEKWIGADERPKGPLQ